jgi:uncharacterized LabA/DUF88 family protein
MERTALFVDLSNFYSNLLRSGIGEPSLLREYFLKWLDFDLLARSLVDTFSGIWVFYSGERIGPAAQRIIDADFKVYISRINRLEGVTAHDANIPGSQRETMIVKCDNCGREVVGEWQSEKGVDAALTVHMFDTMDSWDTAYLLSGDADFVPAVASLRRRGKIIIGGGLPDASSAALVRECYSYVDLCERFLGQDAAAYAVFEDNGLAQQWFEQEVIGEPSTDASIMIRGDVEGRTKGTPTHYELLLSSSASFNNAKRMELIEGYRQRFSAWVPVLLNHGGPGQTPGCRLRFSLPVGRAIARRICQFGRKIPGVEIIAPGQPALLTRHFVYNHKTQQYDVPTS